MNYVLIKKEKKTRKYNITCKKKSQEKNEKIMNWVKNSHVKKN